MSLFWNVDVTNGGEFYSEKAIDLMVSDMGIELVRYPMGYDGSAWSGNGWKQDPEGQKAKLKTVIDAAVKNDIYVIIDWHSHLAHEEKSAAMAFFQYVSQEYGHLDNVIYEIYNEPACAIGTSTSLAGGNNCAPENAIGWNSTIKPYAEDVIAEIRKNDKKNLIVVGTPYYDQRVDQVIGNTINDANVAYTFHYYASEHGTRDQGAYAQLAIDNGLSVFVTEWGTCRANGGDGDPQGNTIDEDKNDAWHAWLNSNNLSAANWSASKKSEACSAFSGMSSSTLSYTKSGNIVRSYLLGDKPASYTKCSATPTPSSSSTASSSSAAVVGSSELIDDFNDNNNGIEKLGEDAYWYLYTAGGATVSNTQDKDEVWDMFAGTSSNYYAAMKGINVKYNDQTNYPSVGIQANLPEGSLAKCTAITYKYKGASHKVRASMSTITPDKGYEHITLAYDASSTWKTVTVKTADLVQPSWIASQSPANVQKLDWSKVIKLGWVIDQSIDNSYPAELDIDDVTCVGELSGVVEVEDKSSSSVSGSSSSKNSSSSAGASSSSSVKGSSSSAAPVVSEANIDDFEDGDNVANTGDEDYWYAFNDVNDGGLSTITNKKNTKGDYVVVIAEAAASGSEYGAGMTGIKLSKGTNENDPYVTLGLNIANGLAGCKTISYKYKGAAHNLKAVMKGDGSGTLTGYNRHYASQTSSTSWKEVFVDVSDLKQAPGWGKTVAIKIENVVQLHWEVKGTASLNYLFIDDVSCVGMDVEPSEGSSSSTVIPGTKVDLEINDNKTNVTGGYWYVYTDTSTVSVGNETDKYGYVIVEEDPEGNYVHMDGIKATDKHAAGIGTELKKSATCISYSYEYMGAPHVFKAELTTVTEDVYFFL